MLRRDLWLLPLISFITILVMLAGAEVGTRLVWPEQLANACRIRDPLTGYRYQPNCKSTMKSAEGQWYTSDYNDCGYRSPTSCGPVPAGTRRVAILGTSLGEGYLIGYPNTIASRLSMDLTRMCNAPVEVQNLSSLGATFRSQTRWMDEALKVHPDAILLMVAPYDFIVEKGEEIAPQDEQPAVDSGGLLHRVFEQIKGSRTVLVSKHFLFQNPAIYLPQYLRSGDWADYLRPPFTADWSKRLQLFDGMIADMAGRARREGVLLMVGFVPFQAQLAFMAGSPVPAGLDPTALSNAIEEITRRHGAAFSDTSVALKSEPDPLKQLYFVVDTHLSDRGQTISGSYIAKRMVDEFDGLFSACIHNASTGPERTP